MAKLDLHALLDAQPVDMTKVEAKVREIERLRADLPICTHSRGPKSERAAERRAAPETG